MAIERDPKLTIMVTTHAPYPDVIPWLERNVGPWNETWWRDFPDIAMIALNDTPEPDCYWFEHEQDAVLFKLKWS